MKRRSRMLSAVLLLATFTSACAPAPAGRTQSELAADALERGVQAQNAGRVDEARLAYFEALSKDTTGIAALAAFYNLGQVARITQKDFRVAVGYYQSAILLDGNHAGSLFGLGQASLELGNWLDARNANAKVVSLEPNNAAAHFNLALALRQLGQESEAQAAFTRARALDATLVPPPSSTPRRT